MDLNQESLAKLIRWYHKVRSNDVYDKQLFEFKINDVVSSLSHFIMNASVVPGKPWIQKNPGFGAVKVGDWYFVPSVKLKLGYYECTIHSLDQLDSINGSIPLAFIELSRRFGWNCTDVPFFDGEPNPFYETVSSVRYFNERFSEMRDLVDREIYRQILDSEKLVSFYDRNLGDDLIQDLKPDLRQTLESCRNLRGQTPDFITKLLSLGEEELLEVISLVRRRRNEIEVIHEEAIQEVLNSVLVQDIMNQ